MTRIANARNRLSDHEALLPSGNCRPTADGRSALSKAVVLSW